MQLTPCYAGSMDGNLCIGAIDDVGDGAMDIASIIAAVEQRGRCAYPE